MFQKGNIRNIIQKYIDKNHIPGCVYSISKNGKFVCLGKVEPRKRQFELIQSLKNSIFKVDSKN